MLEQNWITKKTFILWKYFIYQHGINLFYEIKKGLLFPESAEKFQMIYTNDCNTS